MLPQCAMSRQTHLTGLPTVVATERATEPSPLTYIYGNKFKKGDFAVIPEAAGPQRE